MNIEVTDNAGRVRWSRRIKHVYFDDEAGKARQVTFAKLIKLLDTFIVERFLCGKSGRR